MLEYIRKEAIGLKNNTNFSNIEAIDIMIRRNINILMDMRLLRKEILIMAQDLSLQKEI